MKILWLLEYLTTLALSIPDNLVKNSGIGPGSKPIIAVTSTSLLADLIKGRKSSSTSLTPQLSTRNLMDDRAEDVRASSFSAHYHYSVSDGVPPVR